MPDPRPPLALPDLCVIGGGAAGYAVAFAAGGLGVPTVLVDKTHLSDPLPRAGDIAWEALLAEARRHASGTGTAGWEAGRAAAHAAARSTMPESSAERLGALGVTVIRATARFQNPRTVVAGDRAIRARRFVIATGSVAAVPPIPGLDTVPYLTADTILDLAALPRRVLVIGASPFGIEAAQALRAFGAEVVVIGGGAFLPEFDRELSAPVRAGLAAAGVDVRVDARAESVEPSGTGVTLHLAPADLDRDPLRRETVEGSHLLLAAGWSPAIAEWRPDLAGIACTTTGVAVRANGLTGNRRVYAAGDVTGLGHSPQSAQAQAAVVLRAALFRQPVAFDRAGVPRVLRSVPPLAVVGLTEDEARGRAGRIRVLRWPYRDNARARAEGMTSGHIKVITGADDRVLGVGIVGAEAPELIGLWCLACAQRLKVSDIAALALPGTSLSDLSRRVAAGAGAARAGDPWVGRALRLLRRFG